MRNTAEWFTAGGTIFLGLVVVFQEYIRRWMFKPNLTLAVSNQNPHCIMNSYFGSVERPHYSLRIAVENRGNSESKKVEVFVKDLQRQKGRGDFEPVTNFIGTYLPWTDLEGARVLEVLNPKMPKYCYLARIFWKNEDLPTSWHSGIADPLEDYLGTVTILVFPPPIGSEREQRFGPGNYRLTVRMGGANAKPVEKVLRIDVTGRWTESVSDVVEFSIL